MTQTTTPARTVPAGGRYSNADLRAKYDELAPRHDHLDAFQERLGLRRLRRRLLAQARGGVLEVASGTGRNLPHYPPGCRLTITDLSPGMLALARERAAQLGLSANFEVMSADALSFPDGHFDTVTSTLSTCTFPDPIAALREMARVCKPEGQILLLEHGRSSREVIGRWQDRRAERYAEPAGCYWNRAPLQLVAQSGLRVLETRRYLFGILVTVVAAPPRP